MLWQERPKADLHLAKSIQTMPRQRLSRQHGSWRPDIDGSDHSAPSVDDGNGDRTEPHLQFLIDHRIALFPHPADLGHQFLRIGPRAGRIRTDG